MELAYQEVWDTPAQARRREWALKQLSRAEKLALVADGGPSTKGGDWS